MGNKRICGISFALVLCLGGISYGQLVVDEDLGELAPGTIMLSGDTSGFGSETDYYNLTNPAANWGNEIVYQFTTTLPATSVSPTLAAATGDPDFFILDSTDVEMDGAGKLFAPGNLQNFFLDDGIGDNDGAITVPAGTHYLSATTFNGFDGGTNSDQATYTITVEFAEVQPGDPPTDFIDLGTIADAGEAFTIDTFGSVFDTELGYWDSVGFLQGINDDAGGGLESELVIDGLDAGDYFLGLGEFDTVYEFGFVATSSGFTGGDYTLNYNGQTSSGVLAAGSVQFFRFTIGGSSCAFELGDVNEDGTVDLLDVTPFVAAITGGTGPCQADINEDGAIDLLDVTPFVELLTGG